MTPVISERTGAIVFIPLTRGKTAVIDIEDFDKVRGKKWSATKGCNTFYAVRGIGSRTDKSRRLLPMHRVVLDAPNGVEVDHIDGDGLNNRLNNLRLCSHSQNAQARQRKRAGTSSQFRGVCWDESKSAWRAVIKANQKHIFIGRYKTEEEAARAYDNKAKELFGEFATPNFSTVNN